MRRKLALVIGNSDYADPRLAKLKTPEADVRALADLLRAPEVGGFDAVRALLNRPFAEVQPAIEDIFADSRLDDLVLFYFSGHGVKDDRGQLYLALAETRSQKPRALSISSSFLKDVMDGADARQQVLILDCCYSGAFATGLKAATGALALTQATFEDESRSRGRVVLTATDTAQYAWEGDQVLGETVENSLYTHYLIEALRSGAADEDGDGWVTPNDLHAYILRQVAPRQHPRLFALAQEGAIRLAHNPHPRPAELPEKLRQALESRLPRVRKGAVEQLVEWLNGRNAGLVLAAESALRGVAANEILEIRQIAEEALGRRSLPKVGAPEDDRRKEAEERQRLSMLVEVTNATTVKFKPRKSYKRLPSLDLFDNNDWRRPAQKEIDETASIILKTLKEFGVPVSVVGAKVGPSVTQYQVEPGFVELRSGKKTKVKVGKIAVLADDLALTLSAQSIRIEAPVPGQSYVGIEVPNRRASLVNLRPVMEAEAFQRLNAPLVLALGRDVSGTAVAADLGTMPHLLIAGATGSGKSVCMTALVTCLVANNTPDDLRLILIDPKTMKLIRFNGLPHLYGKVETELDRILGVLRWVVREMDSRYKLFETASARNLDTYNAKQAKKKDGKRLPRIVVMVDELADLMMQAPDETERTIVRLAQLGRTTGIHLIIATQRPSTDIVTGLIKANFPARISFALASGVDSRVILGQSGAERLLGKGDMLYLTPEVATPMHLQGCYVTDKEVDKIVNYWYEQMTEEEPIGPPLVT